MKGDISLGTIKISISHFIEKYESWIFFIIVALAMVTALLLILGVFTQKPEATTDTTATIITESEKQTVEMLENLPNEDGKNDIPKPAGRFSPFFEGNWQ